LAAGPTARIAVFEAALIPIKEPARNASTVLFMMESKKADQAATVGHPVDPVSAVKLPRISPLTSTRGPAFMPSIVPRPFAA
jgi:hypothetical protein